MHHRQNILPNICWNIRACGYSQKGVRKLLIESLYSQYENGTAEPGFDALIRIADVLKCSLDELLGRNSDYRNSWIDSGVVRESRFYMEDQG